jgi:hypothetical protein
VIDTIASQLIQQRDVGRSLWHPFGQTQPFFEQAIPDELSKGLKEDVVAKGGVEPSDEQVYRAYVRSQLIKLYGPKGDASGK